MTSRIIILALLLASTSASGHEAPSGWQYPSDCCSSRDCRPRACDALEQQRDGGVLDVELGQTYTKAQVRPSQDGQCHVCTGAGAPDGRPICAFLVQGF